MKPVLKWENNSPHALHFLHQVREEVHRLIPDAKVILHGSRVRQCNPAGFRLEFSDHRRSSIGPRDHNKAEGWAV